MYEQSYWWSDKWDPKKYGRAFDFSRSFFEQWAELFRDVPQIAMNNQQSENCEFTNQSQKNKDCYLIFCSNESRDCMHGMWYEYCKDCVDGLYLEHGELCYEILNGKNCYGCTFSRNLDTCSDVHFSKNCIGCSSCFGCVNLRNKQYFIFNEKHSKEEYAKKMQEMRRDSFHATEEHYQRAQEFFKKFPHKYYEGSNLEDSSGDYIMNLRDSHDCFNSRNDEHIQHCQDVWRARNCQDLTETVENDFSYSVEGSANSVNVGFSKKFHQLSDAFYCSHCNYSRNLFGCISLNNGQYCILNKQYTKEEYETLVPRIIEHMRKRGEWGEHFPSMYSPFVYNESVAQEYFPRTKEEVLAGGYRWRDETDDIAHTETIIVASDLPDSIHDAPDTLIGQPIRCAVTGRPFRIIKQEMDFYRRMGLPLPRLHYDERHRRRMALRNPRKLWQRQCMNCKKAIETTYAPDRPEIVYCEECYLQEVY